MIDEPPAHRRPYYTLLITRLTVNSRCAMHIILNGEKRDEGIINAETS